MIPTNAPQKIDLQRLPGRNVPKTGIRVPTRPPPIPLPDRLGKLTRDRVRRLCQRQMLPRHLQILPPARASSRAAEKTKDK